jgi:hypothetical protein
MGNQFLSLSPNPYGTILSGRQEGSFIYWEEPLILFKQTRVIMVRDCYEKLYQFIIQQLSSIKNHLVTGVPGIGKSNFCLYFLWRYLQENRGSPILFEAEFDHITYLDPSKSFMTNRIGCFQMRYPYLVDFAALAEPSRIIGSSTILFSSPDPRRFHEMMKDSAIKYILPTWSLEELMQLNQIHSSSLDIISRRFDCIGGIPRHIFSSDFEIVECDVQKALSEKGGDIAKHFFLEGFGMKDEQMSYLLIHLHPDPDPEKCYSGAKTSHTFASPFIWKKLYHLHHRKILMESQNYFNGGTGAYGGSFAGYHFEFMCLDAPPIAGTEQTITPLTSDIQTRILSIPSSQKVDFNKQREQIDLQQNIFYIPTKKIFESGDAFFWSNENELFVFQITVGRSHPVKAHGLDEICKLIPMNKKGLIQKYHLVFVVPAQGQLSSSQQLTTTKGEPRIRKSEEVKSFEANQWRLEYFLPVANTELSDHINK